MSGPVRRSKTAVRPRRRGGDRSTGTNASKGSDASGTSISSMAQAAGSSSVVATAAGSGTATQSFGLANTGAPKMTATLVWCGIGAIILGFGLLRLPPRATRRSRPVDD